MGVRVPPSAQNQPSIFYRLRVFKFIQVVNTKTLITLEVTLEKESKYTKLKISLKESDYQPKVAEKLKEYSKKASIKGFRPGKVPAGLIHKMYGKSILVDEINHMVSHTINDYIKNEKLNVVGDPIPASENDHIDWDNQKDFEFQFNLGVVPEFSVDLDKAKETRYTIKIDDAVLNETIDNLKNQLGEMVDSESVSDNDFLTGDLSATEGELRKEDAMLATDKLTEGAKKLFIGKKPGDTITFDIENAFIDAAAAGVTTGLSKDEAEALKGQYSFSIKTIRTRKPAEINQGFYDRVFGKDTVTSDDEFKTKLKETIGENYQRESDLLLNRDIQEHLVATTNISIPDEFLKEWLLKTNSGKMSAEDIEAQYEYFRKDLKWNLIRNHLIEKAGIKAEHEEVMAKAREYIMQQFGNLPINEEMEETLNKIADNYLKQDNGKTYMQTFEGVLYDKTIAYLKETISITEKEVSLDEFKKIVEAGQ